MMDQPLWPEENPNGPCLVCGAAKAAGRRGRAKWCAACAEERNRERARARSERLAREHVVLCPCGEAIPFVEGRKRNNARCPACARARGENALIVRGREYGLTPDDLDLLIAEQEGRCPICGTFLALRWAIDHDHACCPGKTACGRCVRGILCPSCNNGLGNFRDDPTALRAAADYVERSWRSQKSSACRPGHPESPTATLSSENDRH